ncbi:23S rRNA (adenine(2030)-N(6))-methyltransferase RlmJ [Chitinilyticum piscinae]|uniref:Ribosomal RNA large subunit methyltransferase J n=1 Tax=Chitinilyticum piscinae TaxID=2866724 RepID=A0A8J7FFS5_9NEIS|nr:23S rRNA (adenine(2030)-N(6))-methyltransferase RlmJ [Chitinilyticum piscinae]MBE9608568.1 23S rRNA (adenine(2030)-N(6))-methyltransferase RlmJ [Chitinilyticum piscinae]
MLSYRHAFHAGNHADVLKHCIELLLLDYLNQKDKPWWYIDSHAGAGLYALTEGFAAKNAEFNTGIGRLWQAENLSEPLQRYVSAVRAMNPGSELRHYPGSPWFALQCAREDDRLKLFELHPSDHELLAGNFEHVGRRAQMAKADGFNSLKSVLPPQPRRALTLIDPPYEVKDDYRRVPAALDDALKRFATGIYAVWYPLLGRTETREMPEKLKKLPANGWLRAELQVRTPARDGFGMHGSGMFILNPPWTLAGTLQSLLPELVELLGEDAGARFVLEHHSN